VYPNAPVALVAIEARHTTSPSLGEGEQSELKRRLANAFPLPQPTVVKTMSGPLGGPASMIEETRPRFATRDQSTAVTMSTEAVVIETTRHETFENLLGLFGIVVDARQEIAPVEGLVRLGLRYVDEVRVPDLSDASEGWAEWVDRSLLGPAPIGETLGLVPEQSLGVVVFDRGDGRKLSLRYGPHMGYAVNPGGPLQRPTPPPGPFFLLDLDSFWTPVAEVPEFNKSVITELCTDLHEPVYGLFESLITERLRKEVLRNA
jgi:uncharacterized protein (TIGR04255 family)